MVRHPLSERFHELLAKSGELHDRKQADYGTDENPFANVQASQDFGVPGWIGAMIRANDKMKRIQKASRQVIEGGEIELENESMENSLFDLAVYCLISYVLFEDGQKSDPQDVREDVEELTPGPLGARFCTPVNVTPREPLASLMPDIPPRFPLKWRDEMDAIFNAIRHVQAKHYTPPESLFLGRRSEGDLVEGDTRLWGLPVSIDETLEPNEFVLRTLDNQRMLIHHHYHLPDANDEGLDPIALS